MDSCLECRERLRPLGMNPTVPMWDRRERRYFKPTCFYCSNYDPDAEPYDPFTQLETKETPKTEIIHRYSNMGKQEYDLLQQTVRKVKYLQDKLAERDLSPAKPRYRDKRDKSKGLKAIE